MLLDTPICDFGQPAPDFRLATPDGTVHTLSQHLGDKGLLVAFICNHCPYVKAIADRLAQDAATLLDEGIGVVAIMSNDYRAYPADAPPQMQAFARRHGFPFPYLVDEDQSVGRAYGAVCTPDFFGYNAAGGLQYRGRLDSLGPSSGPDRDPELLTAMRQIAATGEGPRDQTPSMGCSIKWRD
ncbi:thioredoxin family protein [Pseudaestuariivita atlantica]|uniref:Alkyl hydroperoxide reductase n=1 Tax=Pseudaestuariivita atlantica TaxID=1317121 RepID=A0A0L1JTF5_9RHOB|nr:thioredoxin family protein [Pseudaestuariivita atlantica]KNG95054.1 alkyl hydroperoxide reductase [Pseudaestuariivita atlantica]